MSKERRVSSYTNWTNYKFYEKILKIVEKFYNFFNIKYDPQRSITLSKFLAKKILKKSKITKSI